MSEFIEKEEAAGSTVVPELAAAFKRGAAPKLPASPPFFLAAHPERWTLFEGHVVPSFTRLHIEGGVNGVTMVGKGEKAKPSIGDAKTNLEEQGYTIIPWDAIPDSHAVPGQPKSYLYQPEGTAAHLTIYERSFPGSEHVEPDKKRYIEFCKYLQDAGVIKPPPLYVLERMAERELMMVSEKDRRRHAEERHRVHVANLAALNKAIERRRGEMNPELAELELEARVRSAAKRQQEESDQQAALLLESEAARRRFELETEARIRAEVEAKLRAEMETKLRAEVEAKLRAEVEAKATADKKVKEEAKAAKNAAKADPKTDPSSHFDEAPNG